MSTKEIAKAALLTAIIAVFSVITFKIGTVPITLSVFAVLFAAVAAGAKTGTAAVAVYILLGAVGLPVFSSFQGGISVLVGPTGGYIISYIFMALIVGIVSGKSKKFAARFAACLVSLIVCYALGTLQFCIVMKQSVSYALAACVYPFVIFDIIKCAAAVFLGGKVKELTA